MGVLHIAYICQNVRAHGYDPTLLVKELIAIILHNLHSADILKISSYYQCTGRNPSLCIM